MLFSIPILVEERPLHDTRLASFTVRPLFHAEPVRRADRLSRALNQLANDLHDLLTRLGRNPRHDALAEWTFNPALEEVTLDLRLELKSGSYKCQLFFVGYDALDRKLYFTPTAQDLHFEVLPGQSLAERATAVLTRHFREREKEGAFDPAAVSAGVRARLTALEITLQPASRAKEPKASTRALMFGGMEKKDGETELRQTGRSLQQQYPDDLDHALDREREVAELARLLAGTDRRPIVLVGPRKVGKTTIIHEVVRRMCTRKAERYGGGHEVWLLSPMRLVSGMSHLGEWENRVLAILDYAEKRDKVLYFDDLLGLVTAGVSSASDLNMAQVLKPVLEKRGVRILAEITPEAWRVLRERDRTFAELFHVIPVIETTEAETLRVMVNVTRRLEEQHGCEFAVEVVPTVYELHRRFGRNAAFPGKAAAFLRRLAVRFAGSAVSETQALNEFQEQTGLHAAFLHDRIELSRKHIIEGLRARVAGQNHALDAFADVLVKLKARLHDPRRPLGTFLLLGPTGVGKTQAAKSLAAYLFGHPDRLVRFDLNEYVDAAAASRLTGTTRDPEGLLTSAIRRQPFSVVLFDEIEKAAPEVFDLLLTVLDEGRLTDALGRVADFTYSLLVLTSNLGAREARARLGFGAGTGDDEHAIYLRAAEKFFRPEFFNRLDRVIPFQPLEREQLERIARQLIAEVLSREGMRRRECLLNVLPAAMTRLVELGHDPQLGARALKRVIEREVAQPLARHLAVLLPGTPTVATLDAVADQFVLKLEAVRPVTPVVSWGETLAISGGKPAHREWAQAVLHGVHTFLQRVETELESGGPSGRMEIGKIPPEQARYFFCREQLQKVERIASAARRSLEPGRRNTRAAHAPKSRQTNISDRQLYSRGLHHARAASTLRVDLAELAAADPIAVPDSPIAALLREAALLEAMTAPPTDDRPATLVLRAFSELDAGALSSLARAYREGIAGLWGGSATFLFDPVPHPSLPLGAGERVPEGRGRRGFRGSMREPFPASPLPGPPMTTAQALWCQGLNLRRLLPVAPGAALVRRKNGTLGIILVTLRHADSESDMRARLKNELVEEKGSAGVIVAESFGEALHLLVVGKTLTDFRSGLVVPAEPTPEESRAFLLSSLPLPSEINV